MQNKIDLASVGPHLVGKVENLSYEETDDGAEMLFQFLMACGLLVEAKFNYSRSQLDDLDRQSKDYEPFFPGQWVEVVLDDNGRKSVRSLDWKGGKTERGEA